jgi:nitronate monooxygenase
MNAETRFSKLVGIEHPIVQAPMAGGATTAELVAAVSNAGGLGSFAGGYLSPDQIRTGVAEIRARTKKPFNVNLFVLNPPSADPAQVAKTLKLLQPIRDALGLPAASAPAKYSEDPLAQFDALVEAAPPVASFTFGALMPKQMAALKARGTLVMGTATNVAEARMWEQISADMICTQGSEAGAHRGTFLGDFESAMIGTMALVPQVVDAVKVPVLAAGGIMDGRGIAAALMLGAAGVQMGTAFLLCSESGISAPWKEALRGARGEQTRVTRIYSGKPARGIENEFMRRLTPLASELPPYPIQNALTSPIRQASARANRPEFLSLFAGQGVSMCRELPAAELVANLVEETRVALARNTSSVW